MPDVNVTVRPLSPGAQRAELVSKVIMAAYSLFVAWQMAKVICPPLAVQEKIAVAWLQKHLPHRPRKVSQREADDLVADVTKYAREQES
jgi:hypothetical protein